MYGIHDFWVFLAAALVVNITPGPDMIYVATRSAAQGRAAGVVSALAIGAGCLVHITAAVLGLSAVLMYSATAFTALKLAGAGYLVFLGIKALRESNAPALEKMAKAPLKKVFRQGVVINVLNPKVALFFLAFLPQFTDHAGNFALQMGIMGSIFCFTGTVTLVLVALGVDRAGAWMQSADASRWRGRISGTAFIGLGAFLAVSDN
ncbi:MAG: LysE family translocator [Desulfovibrio sp.]|uniref:LysE family translocator n=1 Tax=Desulfovibrio sp. 7SRBS1 TaxID=3378064 RepID=UPI003B3D457C